MTSIPTIADLYAGVLADLQTEFGVIIDPDGAAFLRAFAAVQAGKLKLSYLEIGQLQKNIFVDTADPEESGGTLQRYGRVKIKRNPLPATQGTYTITVTTPNTGGGSVAAGTVFKSDDTSSSPGKLFISDLGGGISFPSDTIDVRALEAGTGSKLIVGDTLSLTAPLVDIDNGATVNIVLSAPTPAENIEDYRAKTLQSYRLYPQGGASADYRLWGLQATGVKQIYPYAASGSPNEINIFVEATIAASTDAMGTPDSTILSDTASDIQTDPDTGKGRRPMGVFAVHTLPVIINKIDITISGASTISSTNRSLITAALGDAIAAVRPFIAGCDTLAEKNDNFGVNSIISTILATVPGSIFSSVAMNITIGGGSPVPTTTKTFDSGNIPFLISVTYS